MVDVLLIQPPIRDFYLTKKRTIPYGLSCIAAALEREGVDVDILDGLATAKSRIVEWPKEMGYLFPYYGRSDETPFGLFHHFRHYGYSYSHIGKTAKDSKAFLVGISSLFTAYSDEALETARIVKKYHPACKIVMGGHHPTAMPESVLFCEDVDYVLRGEAEVSMTLLTKAILKGDSVENVPGIGFRKDTGDFYIREPAVIKKMNDLPLPAHHLIKSAFYRKNKRRNLVITASRGCPMRCSYCAINADSYLMYRKRSVEYVIREIEKAVLLDDVGYIDFEDENLTLDKNWFLQLLDRIISQFGKLNIELRAMNGLYAPSIDEEVVAAMKEAGFRALNLSLCTTDKSQLRQFSRPNVTRAIESVLKWASIYDLEAVGYIISGAPGQIPESSLADLIYLAGLRVLVGLSVYYPAPGSRDFDQCRKLRMLPDDFSLMRSSVIPLSHRTSRLESVTLLRLARILNFMKSLLDRGKEIPKSSPYVKTCSLNSKDRVELGIRVLKWFLNDGKIRGVTKDGKIYEHLISEKLTAKFIRELDITRLKGCRQ